MMSSPAGAQMQKSGHQLSAQTNKEKRVGTFRQPMKAWQRVKHTRRLRVIEKDRQRAALTIELQAHAVVDLVVLKSDVVLVDGVPFLNPQLLRPRTRLRREELLQITDRIIFVALDANLLAEAVIANSVGAKQQAHT